MADGLSFRTLPIADRIRVGALADIRAARPVMTVDPGITGLEVGATATPASPATMVPIRDRIPLEPIRLSPDVIARFGNGRGLPTPAVPPVSVGTSAANPFNALPHPNPGDRIRSDDFRHFSQCLEAIQQACTLSASLFGRTLADAKQAIAAQQYTIARVMSVFGTVLTAGDASLDQRSVVQVQPVAFGERALLVVVSEAVETRRLAPNLTGLTHAEAMDRLHAALGDVTFPQTNVTAGQLVGRTLSDAASAVVQPTS
jgi:hypothetical protein